MYPKGKPYPKSSYDANGLKICSDCNNHKEITMYPSNISTYDKISNICKECTNQRSRNYYNRNKEKEANRRREKYLRNKEKEIHNDNLYKKKRRLIDPEYKLLRNIRDRHSKAVKYSGFNKNFSSINLLGCDSGYLKKYIEIQFRDGMNWNNYGRYGWHIDHIIPCSSFDLSDQKQQKKCFHYSNLQPLWATDNLKKHSKIIY
jgi:hypothetical protein